jgi:hypothetical protein
MPNTLRVELSAVGHGCVQDATPPATFPRPGNYALLLNCDLSSVIKAGKEFGPVPFDHGYCEFHDVDPGNYVILVVVNPAKGAGNTFHSNMICLHQLVVCGCCETICVRVYQTGWHQCFSFNVQALQLLKDSDVLTPELADPAINALGEVLRQGPPDPTDPPINALLTALTGRFERAEG